MINTLVWEIVLMFYKLVMSHKIEVGLLYTWLGNSNTRRWKTHARLVEGMCKACGGVWKDA